MGGGATQRDDQEALAGLSNAQLETLCQLSCVLGYGSEAADWRSTSRSKRDYLHTVTPSLLADLAVFVQVGVHARVPGQHVRRVRRIPGEVGRQIVARILAAIHEDDEDDDGFDKLSLARQLEILLEPVESRLILQWFAYARKQQGPAARVASSRASQAMPTSPEELFPSVVGLVDVKGALFRHAYLPLLRPDLHRRYGIVPERGVLLYGPPGNGKTQLARALAAGAGLHLEYVGGPELLSKWVGETEAALRRVFAAAESHAPSVVFLDEIDALGARRSRFDAADACHVQQLLSLMDGLEHQPGVLVIGATNRIEAIDPALLRPGRFGLVLEVPAPDAATRARIVGIHLGGKPVEGELDLDAIARLTEGFSGAQLMALCQEAAQAALEREVATGEGQVVSQLDLVRARGRIAESGRGGD